MKCCGVQFMNYKIDDGQMMTVSVVEPCILYVYETKDFLFSFKIALFLCSIFDAIAKPPACN